MANPNNLRGYNSNIALDRYAYLIQPTETEPVIQHVTRLWLKRIIEVEELDLGAIITTEQDRVYLSRWIPDIRTGLDFINDGNQSFRIVEVAQLNRRGYMTLTVVGVRFIPIEPDMVEARL